MEGAICFIGPSSPGSLPLAGSIVRLYALLSFSDFCSFSSEYIGLILSGLRRPLAQCYSSFNFICHLLSTSVVVMLSPVNEVLLLALFPLPQCLYQLKRNQLQRIVKNTAPLASSPMRQSHDKNTRKKRTSKDESSHLLPTGCKPQMPIGKITCPLLAC